MDFDLPPAIFKNDLTPDQGRGSLAQELGYLALHGMDWAQTRTIAKNPQQWSETNRILGEHPSVGKVNNYFLATGLAHALASQYLPPDLAKWLQYGTIGLEAGVTGRNKFKLGIGMTF